MAAYDAPARYPAVTTTAPHRAPPIALNSRNVGYGIRTVPASAGITARKKATQRPSSTAQPPRRASRSCARSSRSRRPSSR